MHIILYTYFVLFFFFSLYFIFTPSEERRRKTIFLLRVYVYIERSGLGDEHVLSVELLHISIYTAQGAITSSFRVPPLYYRLAAPYVFS